MKKIFSLLGFVASLAAYAQGPLVINNYSDYDFRGHVIAHDMVAPCYPRVANNVPIIVPADSHMGNGLQLEYKNFRDQFGTSLYPMADWSVATSPNNDFVWAWNDANLVPGGTISNTTKWGIAKFGMVYAGTTIGVPGFGGNIALYPNPCYPYLSGFTTSNGLNSADIFTITSGTVVTTYIQIF
ncbi:hypothetical protein [Chryseobacterium vrystaatense]|uniref:Uncharacterized protein n=1 Tax=Chryseobacterium vrystaatense TaxID=307480 RepID=A0A1M5PAW8_9FLAO|nr:hypothetical protein [Chryseobacterium vrystaatense]KFF24612.1 hypothetical protein IW16_20055 [Chryseobacterium vrystaatense]SHG98825.1 hypothetical protein SAMN02787073_0028 [Chryseobacterium vrystaatense]